VLDRFRTLHPRRCCSTYISGCLRTLGEGLTSPEAYRSVRDAKCSGRSAWRSVPGYARAWIAAARAEQMRRRQSIATDLHRRAAAFRNKQRTRPRRGDADRLRIPTSKKEMLAVQPISNPCGKVRDRREFFGRNCRRYCGQDIRSRTFLFQLAEAGLHGQTVCSPNDLCSGRFEDAKCLKNLARNPGSRVAIAVPQRGEKRHDRPRRTKTRAIIRSVAFGGLNRQ